jgi:hypothetical protein
MDCRPGMGNIAVAAGHQDGLPSVDRDKCQG